MKNVILFTETLIVLLVPFLGCAPQIDTGTVSGLYGVHEAGEYTYDEDAESYLISIALYFSKRYKLVKNENGIIGIRPLYRGYVNLKEHYVNACLYADNIFQKKNSIKYRESVKHVTVEEAQAAYQNLLYQIERKRVIQEEGFDVTPLPKE